MSSYDDVSLFDMRQRCSNPPQVVLGLPSFALLNDIETGESVEEDGEIEDKVDTTPAD